MQSRLRLHLATAITLFALLFLSPPVRAQADRLLPSSWNDAVNQLAHRVAAVVDPATPVSLEMENISAIEGSDQNYIESDFENALRQHSLIIYPPSSSAIRLAVRLHLTLSESADAYIWAVQIFNNPHDPNSFSSAIVSVPRLTGYGSTSGGLPVVSLERRLVWKQPSRFLDFDIVKDSAVGDAALLILQTDRLTVYKLSGPDWVLFREIPISSAPSRSRAPEGSIEAQKNSIYVPGLACTIDLSFAGRPECVPFNDERRKPETIPGQPDSLGDARLACQDGRRFVLYTGEGDWTQRDLIQGYFVRNRPLPMVPSGNPIQFDGPVVSLQTYDANPYSYDDPKSNSARAVIHNLKTNNYEAYFVTATCVH